MLSDDLVRGVSFDALRAPFGGDFLARDAPDFFSVAFEELTVETISEAIDQEILEGNLRRSVCKLVIPGAK